MSDLRLTWATEAECVIVVLERYEKLARSTITGSLNDPRDVDHALHSIIPNSLLPCDRECRPQLAFSDTSAISSHQKLSGDEANAPWRT